jgi:hypothetical protein
MKGDFSRTTFEPERHFKSVRMQQGRVQLDADWNEQADIGTYRVETGTADLVGACGGPLHDAAFALVLDPNELDAEEKALFPKGLGPGDFLLGRGRYYVDGILCENEHAVLYTAQPDLPDVSALDVSKAGSTIVYLDVWERNVTALDVPRLRETALTGPDTATRSRTVWQVRAVFAGDTPTNCLSTPAAFTDATAGSTGLLRARAQKEDVSPDPCIVPPSAGFRGLENQLYRVEIHDPGAPADLGAGGDVEITAFPSPNQVTYASGAWTVGQAVEIFPAKAGSDPMEGHLAFVAANDAGTSTLTLDADLPGVAPGDPYRLRPARATYTWSRDNGSVVTLVKTISGRDVVVHSLGAGNVPDFEVGQWVELSDDARELNGLPGHLAQIEAVDEGTSTITLRAAPAPFPGDVAPEDPARHLKLRRWDGAGAVKTNAPAPSEGYADLEDGVQVRFEAGTYHTGDYWSIPARTATADAQSGTIEWPQEGSEPAARPPLGIEHHYCRLGILTSDGAKLTLQEDCRGLFPPATELATLVYVGGDGQEAMPGDPLPKPLEVGVFRGRWPVANAHVRFTPEANGQVGAAANALEAAGAAFSVTTGADGVARCFWQLDADPAKPSQTVKAELLDSAGQPLPPFVDFDGNLSVAAEVSYTPDPTCVDLKDAHTVQQALDLLCKRPTGQGCAITVRPDQRLDEVIKELVGNGQTDLCICLAAGDYDLPEGLVLENRDVSLELTGCGAGTRIKMGAKLVLFGLRAVVFRDLQIDFTGEDPDALAFDGCVELTIESCRISKLTPGEAMCRVGGEGARRIRVAHNVLETRRSIAVHPPLILNLVNAADAEARALAARDAKALTSASASQRLLEMLTALDLRSLSTEEQEAYQALAAMLGPDALRGVPAIAAALLRVRDAILNAPLGNALVVLDGGAATEIVDNEILGVLGLYGIPTRGFPNQDQLKLLTTVLGPDVRRLTLTTAEGNLWLRGNRLARVTIPDSMLSTLTTPPFPDTLEVTGLFRSIFAGENVFIATQSILVGSHLAFTANRFEATQGQAGATVADVSAYTGNTGSLPGPVVLTNISQQTAAAANVLVAIQ